MITPTSPVYAKMVYASLVIFGVAFIGEMYDMLRDNHWNVIKTIKDFFLDF